MNDDPLVTVVQAADAAEPRREVLNHMADTVKVAHSWLIKRGFKQVRVDRWDRDGLLVELGYVHGEVWFRVWKRNGDLRHKTETRIPGNIYPLIQLVDDVAEGRI